MFSFEALIGIKQIPMPLFNSEGFNLPAGYILWPVVFIMTDVMNEYFGKAGVRKISILTAFMISYVFIFLFITSILPAPQSWIDLNLYKLGPDNKPMLDELGNKIYLGDINYWVNRILSSGIGIIIGSLIAFLVGQLLDAYLFQWFKNLTNGKHIWLRATGSTLISQGFDSYIVLVIAFYLVPMAIGNPHPVMSVVLGWATLGYIYKVVVAFVLTPVIYLAHSLIDKYLGKEILAEMHAQVESDEDKEQSSEDGEQGGEIHTSL